jgi:hypothetical protein
MTGEDVREVCETILPPQDIARLCVPCGVMARPRTLPLGRLVRALVIAAGPPGGAYQADSLRSYLACAVPRVTRSACYRGFDAPLDQCLAALAERALADVGGPRSWSNSGAGHANRLGEHSPTVTI